MPPLAFTVAVHSLWPVLCVLQEYFEHFLLKKPQGAIDSYFVRWPCKDTVNLEGTYTFTFKATNTQAHARFSYQWKKQPNGKWLILEHHSSAMPEPVATKAP